MAAAERAFAAAAHVTRVRLVNNRIVVAAMEPRAAVAEYDPASGRFTLHVGCQGVFGLRRALAEDLLRIEPERLRVLAYDIGGSFGMKAAAYPEYVGILHAAQALGRPVKWCDERSGSFVSDQQGRGTLMHGELALDADGNFLAVRVRNVADMGAYLTAFGPAMPAVNMQKNLPSLYRTPIVAISTRCVFTNSVPIGPYRGAGRPEANYLMERLVDTAARETGRDPAALRRQNLVPQHAMPYRAASGLEYDSGDFAAVLDAGLDHADWAGFAARRDASAANGRLRGRGLACYLEVTAPPSPEMGGIRFEPDGRVTIVTGTLDYGQGHASAFAQVLVERLGLPFELIDLIQGDSDELLVGGGTGGSRSIMASGKALVEAAAEVIEKGRMLAGHFLEAAAADIEFAAGRFRIAGTDRSIALLDLAARVREAGRAAAGPARQPRCRADLGIAAVRLPERLPCGRGRDRSRDGAGPARPLHRARRLRHAGQSDAGRGPGPRRRRSGHRPGAARARGVRRARASCSPARSWTTLCRAPTRCRQIAVGFHPVPATTNPLGVKGCGEAGVTGALPAVMNAVLDALASRGVRALDMPATPERVWRALQAGARADSQRP